MSKAKRKNRCSPAKTTVGELAPQDRDQEPASGSPAHKLLKPDTEDNMASGNDLSQQLNVLAKGQDKLIAVVNNISAELREVKQGSEATFQGLDDGVNRLNSNIELLKSELDALKTDFNGKLATLTSQVTELEQVVAEQGKTLRRMKDREGKKRQLDLVVHFPANKCPPPQGLGVREERPQGHGLRGHPKRY